MIVLDASVIIAFLERRDAVHGAATAAVRDAVGVPKAVPSTAFAEVVVGALRRGHEATAAADLFFTRCLIAPVDERVARAAAALRAVHAGLSLPDAVVLAFGEIHDADAVLTADRRWLGLTRRVRLVGAPEDPRVGADRP